MTHQPRKITIIGGGVAGLCAGVYAQASGYQVEILEQHYIPGGLATSWRRGDYTFETCLHWLVGSGPDGVLNAQWREVCDIDALRFVNAEEFQRIECDDGRSLRIFSHVDRMEAEFLQQAPEDAEEIKAFTAAIRQLADFPMQDLMNGSWPHRAWALLRLAPKLPLLQRWSSISAGDFGKRFKNELLRRFFVDAANPEIAAIALVFMFAWMSRGNAGYPIGGSKAIIDLLVARLRALGATLRTGAKVGGIVVANQTAIGVTLEDGSTHHADWVISAADGHATIHHLLGGKYKDERIDQLYAKQPVFPSYVQVSLGVAQDLKTAPAHLVHVLSAPLALDPETTLNALAFRIFNFDPTFAPPGKTAITCFLPTHNFAYWLNLHRDDAVRYEAEKQRIAKAIIDVLDRRLPGLRTRIEVVDVSTPASVIRFTGNWKGSMEGFLPTPGTSLANRSQTLPGLERFFMVGQWVHPGGGLPSGLMTARSAVQAICKHDHVAFLSQSAEEMRERDLATHD